MRRLVVWLCFISSCSWEPVARPVQPQQVFEGPTRVERMLGREQRHALVSTGPIDALRYRIVNTEALTHCDLPPELRPVQHGSLAAPNLKGADAPKFLQPLRARDASDTRIFFTNEKCVVRGPLGDVGRLRTLVLQQDQREVLILHDAQDKVSLIDPWTELTQPIAEGVLEYHVVEAPATPTPGQPRLDALWLNERGKLVQRALDGTLLLSLGEDVQERQFVQRRFEDGLRIAFRDGNDLFEARAPDFTPKLIAPNGCNPSYTGTALDLHYPCEQRQLVRIELMTGAVRRYMPGVTSAFSVAGIDFEAMTSASGEGQLWAVPRSGQRVQIRPLPANPVTTFGEGQFAARTTDNRFGIWSLRGGFTEVFRDVEAVIPFRDPRTSELSWLMMHEVRDQVGRISRFDQLDIERAMQSGTPLEPRLVATGVPASGGYRVAGGVGTELIVLTLEDAVLLPVEKRFAGTLHARLLSGELAARIDEGVSSNLLVIGSQPGILYGITEGEKSGLWFAAL